MLSPEEERSLISERAGALHRQRAYAEVVALLAPLPPERFREEVEPGFLLADSWRRLGERERALELSRQLIETCRRRDNDRVYRNLLNLAGMLQFERGDVEGAEQAWGEMLDASSRANDPDYVARANHNLGVVDTLRGRPEAALASYERALSAYRQLGNLRGIAQAHQNIAITSREMALWNDADQHCRDAIQYARTDGSEDEVARAQQERALVLCLAGDRRLAEATAQQALETWTRLGEPAGIGSTHQVLGVIALSRAEWDRARRHLEEALALARSAREVLLEAETLEALAALAHARGEGAEAEEHRQRASTLFASMGAQGWGERVRSRLSSLTVPQQPTSIP